MTWGGWISMTASVTAVSALFAWCLYHLLKPKSEDPDQTAEE